MIINNLTSIQNEIQSYIKKYSLLDSDRQIIAVSKTFPLKEIIPLVNHGHIHFGENKIQEAIKKWTKLKTENREIKLHMIGKLQTNKVKYIFDLFDYLHSLDNLKLAEKISSEQSKKNKKIKLFIQVNIGNEIQKNGIHFDKVHEFYNICKNDLNLDIIGLMCLPPKNENSENFYSQMSSLKKKIGLPELSMGMSGDYLEAIKNNATYIRVGSKIFGNRS